MNLLDKILDGAATLADQDEALKYPEWAYWFARFIKDADIEKCQEIACKDSTWAYWFARDVFEADIERILEACRGTKYEDGLNEVLMNKVLV